MVSLSVFDPIPAVARLYRFLWISSFPPFELLATKRCPILKGTRATVALSRDRTRVGGRWRPGLAVLCLGRVAVRSSSIFRSAKRSQTVQGLARTASRKREREFLAANEARRGALRRLQRAVEPARRLGRKILSWNLAAVVGERFVRAKPTRVTWSRA